MQVEYIDILLVDDNDSDAEMIIRALKKSVSLNNVLHLKDGEQAMDYFKSEGRFVNRNQSLQPKLVLLDLKMPKVDGKEVLKWMKTQALTKAIPVVMLTSSRQDSDVFDCYDSGANCYVVKPVEYDQFQQTISRLGVFWMQVNQPPK